MTPPSTSLKSPQTPSAIVGGSRYDDPRPSCCDTDTMSEFKTNREAMKMKRLWKVASGVLALIAVGVVLALGPVAARADDGSVGGPTLDPAYQVGNAQGDHSGQ